MNLLNRRIKTHSYISTQLSALSDVQLSGLIDKAEHLYAGIGGKAVLLEIDDTKIFVKKIPLTDLERQPENVRSTANLFELPLSYHIGVGSAGFSSWRELFVHEMTTNWVISGECQNFPILYHWRVLPTSKPKPMNGEELQKLENDVKYWDESSAIRKRLEALHNASAHILLFLEYVPQTLDTWLGTQLASGGNVAALAIASIDAQLEETNKFMLANGFIHFDAHFANILADDNTIYFSDFGLSLSTKFNSTNDELALFDQYKTYDRCSSMTNFLHSIIANLPGKHVWEITLKDVPNDKIGDLEPPVANIIKRYAAIALVMADFYQNMQKISKSTTYPAKQLEKLLAEIGNIKLERIF